MILLLGYLGNLTNKLGGQTVKTRNLFRLLKEIGSNNVDYYDTDEFSSNRLSLLKMFWKVMRCDTLCYLPSRGNLRMIFPIVYFLSIVFRVKIHYFVVGGWLEELLQSLPLHRKMLSRISGIHVETNKQKHRLEELYGFTNVGIFPNFRYSNYDLEHFDNNRPSRIGTTGNLRVAFVSQVEQSKGLDTLVEVESILSSKGFSDKIVIDFYGPKRDDYFDTYLQGCPMFEYRGVLQPEEVLTILRGYDALVFPTHYEGEGCPGILIESLSAGLPIIASNWKYNEEFVENEINGFLCETFSAKAYAEALIGLAENPDVRKLMARQSYMKSRLFSNDEAKILLADIISL